MSFVNLPNELQLEILKQADPDTIINFCKKVKKESNYTTTCNDLFKTLLKNIGFKTFKSSFDYNKIYPDIYYCYIGTFRNKNINIDSCFDETFIKCLINHSSFETIHFLQAQNYKSICFNMSDEESFFIAGEDEEFTQEATEIYKNSFLVSSCPLKRGDVLRFRLEDFTEERNFGKFIFNGKTFQSLDTSIDEYGSCPSDFLVINEFPINYFTASIQHNNYVYSDIKNVNLKELYSGNLNGYMYKLFSFRKNNIKYILFAYNDSDNQSIDSNQVFEKIKTNILYEAGIYDGIFTNNQIKQVHSQVEKNQIPIDNILSLHLD